LLYDNIVYSFHSYLYYVICIFFFFFFFSSRRRHTRFSRDWSSDVCSSDLMMRFIESAEGLALILEQLPGSPAVSQRGVQCVTHQLVILDQPVVRVLRKGKGRQAQSVNHRQIGRASCRERVLISAGAVARRD